MYLYDWYSVCVVLLLKNDGCYCILFKLFLVYIVYNLVLQGICLFKGDSLSLEVWFLGLNYNGEKLCDLCYYDCFNLM